MLTRTPAVWVLHLEQQDASIGGEQEVSCSGQAELFGSEFLMWLVMFFSLFAARFQSIFA